MVRLFDGTVRLAEVHWFEAHGIGKKELGFPLPTFVRTGFVGMTYKVFLI